MTVTNNLEELKPLLLSGSCATIGNFDGVHLGHQILLNRVTQLAVQHNLPSVAVTFDPHPMQVLQGWTPPAITTTEQKLSFLSQAGIEHILCLQFNQTMADLSPENFVYNYLVQGLKVKELIIGHDYAFGKKRRGNFRLLQELGQKYNFQVQQIPPVYYNGEVISSSRIRKLVEQGRVAEVKPLLNRYYQVQGTVIEGAGRGGKLLGVPTANLRPGNRLCPKPGVYAMWVELRDKTLPAVANVGYNPTFGTQALSLEVHILDFQEDIYGISLHLHFVQRIRDEVKFSGVEALLEQIHKDITAVREILRLPENQLPEKASANPEQINEHQS